MQKHYNYLTIDLDKKVYRTLNAKQGDSKSRYILVNLISNNLAYDLTGTSVKIYGKKKDTTIFFNAAPIIDAKNGQFEIELTNQALAVPGYLKIEILVLGANQERLSTSYFYINVEETIIDDAAIESTNEFTALTNALSEVQDIDNKFSKVNEQFNTKASKIEVDVERKRIDNIIAVEGSSDNLETADIRVDSFGITHESAGQSVRTNINSIYNEIRHNIVRLDTLYSFVKGFRVNGYNTTTLLPNVTSLAGVKYVIIDDVSNIKKITTDNLYTNTINASHMFIYIQQNGKVPFGISGLNIVGNEWFIINESNYVIDVEKLRELKGEVNSIYICIKDGIDLNFDLEFYPKDKTIYEYIDNQITNFGDQDLKLSVDEFVEGYRINAYISGTLKPNITANPICKYTKIDINGLKYIKTNKIYTTSQTIAHNFIFIANEYDEHLKSISYTAIQNQGDWLTVSDIITVDVEKLYTTYPTARYIYFTMIINDAVELIKISHSLLSLIETNKTNIDKTKAELVEKLNDSKRNYSIVLPSKIHAVVGQTINVWVDNFLRGARLKDLAMIRDLDSSPSKLYDDVFIFSPTQPSSDTEGTRTLIRAFDKMSYSKNEDNPYQFNAGLYKYVKYISIPKDVGNGVTKDILFIGDSITENGYFLPVIKRYFESDVANVNIVGTYSKMIDGIECASNGHAGWAAKHFCQNQTYGSSGRTNNEFWNPSTSKFDFAYAMSTSSINNVDYVFINLGTNDNVSSNAETYDEIISHYDEMITSIKAFNPNVSIFVGLTLLQADIDCKTAEMRYRVQGFIEKLIDKYDNRENEKIYLVPLYTNMCNEGYGIKEKVVNPAMNITKKYVNDITHPNLAVGGVLEGDPLIAAIKYAMWKESI